MARTKESSLRRTVAHAPNRRAEIRRFFLDRKELYSVEELADFWRVRADDVRAIYHDDLAGSTPADVPAIAWVDAAGAMFAFNLIRPVEIERALGRNFLRIRPETWLTVRTVVYLPMFVRDALLREPSLVRKPTVAARVEQLPVELFTSAGAPADRENRR